MGKVVLAGAGSVLVVRQPMTTHLVQTLIFLATVALLSACEGGDSKSSPDREAPTVPTGLAVQAVNPTTVDLSWVASVDAVSGVGGYRIYRDGVQVASIAETRYRDVGVSPGQKYLYSVSAFDSSQRANESTRANDVPVRLVYVIEYTSLEVDFVVQNRSINDRGQVIGTHASQSGSHRCVLYDRGTLRDLVEQGAAECYAKALSDAGLVVGYYHGTDEPYGPHAFLSGNGTITILGSGFYAANDINESGQVVGSGRDQSGATGAQHALLYVDGAVTDLGALPAINYSSFSDACCINENGQVAGSAYVSGILDTIVFHAFDFGNGELRDRGTCGMFSCTAVQINQKGDVLATAHPLGVGPELPHSVILFADGTRVDLPGPATDINDEGWVVGTSNGGAILYGGAFLYKDGAIVDLTMFQARPASINNSGYVLGTGSAWDPAAELILYSFNDGHAWRLDDLLDPNDPLHETLNLSYGYKITDTYRILASGCSPLGCGAYVLSLKASAQ